jgi:hypothetical protein
VFSNRASTLLSTVSKAGRPLVALIFAGAIGSFFWLDLLHGIGVVFGIPKVLHIA